MRVSVVSEAFGSSTHQHDQIHFSSSYLHTQRLKAETYWMPFSLLSKDYLSGLSWLADVSTVSTLSLNVVCVCACVYVCAVSPVIMARWHSLSTSSEKYLGAPFGYRPWIDPATASPSFTLCSSRDLLGLLGCRNDGILVLFIPGTRLHLSHAWMLKEHVTPLKQRRVKYYTPRKDVRAFFFIMPVSVSWGTLSLTPQHTGQEEQDRSTWRCPSHFAFAIK